MSWTKPYCGIQHFQGRRGHRVQISVMDRGTFAEVHRLDLGDLHPLTPTHWAMRNTVAEAQAVGEAWARGDYTAPERLPSAG